MKNNATQGSLDTRGQLSFWKRGKEIFCLFDWGNKGENGAGVPQYDGFGRGGRERDKDLPPSPRPDNGAKKKE